MRAMSVCDSMPLLPQPPPHSKRMHVGQTQQANACRPDAASECMSATHSKRIHVGQTQQANACRPHTASECMSATHSKRMHVGQTAWMADRSASAVVRHDDFRSVDAPAVKGILFQVLQPDPAHFLWRPPLQVTSPDGFQWRYTACILYWMMSALWMS